MAREINLVPEIKGEMIKTLRLRNFIFFLCIVVAAASAGITVFTGLIVGGQNVIIKSNNEVIDELSAKLASYDDLTDFLTVKKQLDNIDTLTSNKRVFSRTFNILSAILPTGPDTVEISDLTVNFQEGQAVFSFDAQANAGSEPYIDYNVLDSFKKSMSYMRYDYGKYVDKKCNEIPAYCIIQSSSDGTIFREGTNFYALWTINGDGCNPSDNKDENDYATEEYDGEQVVRIWRTPRFDEWYKDTEVSGQPYMTLDGRISNVAHFESACTTYRGVKDEKNKVKWTEINDECKLINENAGTDKGISISGSSNGRDDDNKLVLRFSAKLYITPEVYKASNTHMLAMPPKNRRNVTDSYVQVEAMFGARAKDCAKDDEACKSKTNSNGE